MTQLSIGSMGVGERRFSAGDSGRIQGLDFRVLEGRKRAKRTGWNDLKLEWRIPTWTPVSMHWLYLGTDFLTENEDALYPPEVNPRWLGGEYLMRELRRARDAGWVHVAQSLDIEIALSDCRNGNNG